MARITKTKHAQNLGADQIVVRGARTHNLDNVDVSIPRNEMVVFTGLSGSGKSSLAFDTIFAEGQRKYMESLSAYARQFLNQMQKPEVEEITGLSPAISIDQKARGGNPRSTVATITEIYDYLRVLYARIGRPHCLTCGDEIRKLTHEEIKNLILDKISHYKKKGGKSVLEFPLYVTVYAPVVRGRKGEYYQMLYDLLGKGYSEVRVDGELKRLRERIVLTKTKRHDIDLKIDSIGITEFLEDKADAEERLSEAIERSLHEAEGLVHITIEDSLDKKVIEEFTMSSKYSCPRDGFSFPEIEPRLFSFNSPYGACPECNGLGTHEFFRNETCKVCKGARLRPESLKVLVGDKNIVDFTSMSILEAEIFMKEVSLTDREKDISAVLLREISSRLTFMKDVGISYLTLDRRAGTLSGGESQRIRLASQLGSGLVGALYVLDEPTIGLHSRDNQRLIDTLLALKDLGNTIIIVEHDEDTIFASDYLVDIGPGAGVHGGKIVASGYLDELLKDDKVAKKSLTLQYLRGDKVVPLPTARREGSKGALVVKSGNVHNIKDMNVKIPLGRFNVVTGVSGSGKSSLMHDIVYKNLQARLVKKHRSADTYNCAEFTGSEYVGRVVMIDQSPIGRTPRSNPATYTGAFTHIRDLFAETIEAKERGWAPKRFSFNVKGGRCEVCEGKGYIPVEMHFLPTVDVKCDICGGKRYTKETLEVSYKGKNIHEVLRMTIEEALEFYEDIPAIYDRLKTLCDVGLGYLELGQSATTLSGGEAQRVKISSELYKAVTQKTVYFLDEPTIGLHYEDVAKLIDILQLLVEQGNTVCVIEHNMDLIKNADYVIDIGPEGGNEGGKVVACGTPESVAQVKESYTGQYLKKVVQPKKAGKGKK